MCLLLRLILLIETIVLAHGEEQLVARIDDLLEEASLVVHREWLLRIVHNHVLGQVEELTNVLLLAFVVFASQEQEVMVEEDHPHDFYEAITLQTNLRTVLVPREILVLEQTNLLQTAHLSNFIYSIVFSCQSTSVLK